MRNASDKTQGWALITGASSGIGLALAQRCALEGHRLILCAQDPIALESVAQALRSQFPQEFRILVMDLSEPGAGAVLVENLPANLEIDRLIINAGFGIHYDFLHSDKNREARMMRLLMDSIVAIIRPLAMRMVHRGAGRILIVASTAAFQPGPYMAVYYASKAFQVSLGLALREEFRATGVFVTVLCPGPTRTGFLRRAGISETPLIRWVSMSPERVALVGYNAMERGVAMAVPGWGNRLGVFASIWLPKTLMARMVARIQKGWQGH